MEPVDDLFPLQNNEEYLDNNLKDFLTNQTDAAGLVQGLPSSISPSVHLLSDEDNVFDSSLALSNESFRYSFDTPSSSPSYSHSAPLPGRIAFDPDNIDQSTRYATPSIIDSSQDNFPSSGTSQTPDVNHEEHDSDYLLDDPYTLTENRVSQHIYPPTQHPNHDDLQSIPKSSPSVSSLPFHTVNTTNEQHKHSKERPAYPCSDLQAEATPRSVLSMYNSLKENPLSHSNLLPSNSFVNSRTTSQIVSHQQQHEQVDGLGVSSSSPNTEAAYLSEQAHVPQKSREANKPSDLERKIIAHGKHSSQEFKERNSSSKIRKVIDKKKTGRWTKKKQSHTDSEESRNNLERKWTNRSFKTANEIAGNSSPCAQVTEAERKVDGGQTAGSTQVLSEVTAEQSNSASMFVGSFPRQNSSNVQQSIRKSLGSQRTTQDSSERPKVSTNASQGKETKSEIHSTIKKICTEQMFESKPEMASVSSLKETDATSPRNKRSSTSPTARQGSGRIGKPRDKQARLRKKLRCFTQEQLVEQVVNLVSSGEIGHQKIIDGMGEVDIRAHVKGCQDLVRQMYAVIPEETGGQIEGETLRKVKKLILDFKKRVLGTTKTFMDGLYWKDAVDFCSRASKLNINVPLSNESGENRVQVTIQSKLELYAEKSLQALEKAGDMGIERELCKRCCTQFPKLREMFKRRFDFDYNRIIQEDRLMEKDSSITALRRVVD